MNVSTSIELGPSALSSLIFCHWFLRFNYDDVFLILYSFSCTGSKYQQDKELYAGSQLLHEFLSWENHSRKFKILHETSVTLSAWFPLIPNSIKDTVMCFQRSVYRLIKRLQRWSVKSPNGVVDDSACYRPLFYFPWQNLQFWIESRRPHHN